MTEINEVKVWTIELGDGLYHVGHGYDEYNYYPITSYNSKREAVARLLQLMNLGPVAPQMRSERIYVGETEKEGGAG